MSADTSLVPSSRSTAWPVAVFAYNEEKRIIACLETLASAAPGRALTIFVLANGCTDRTEDIVRRYARQRRDLTLVSIALGDKAHAWNHYVHELAPDREIHFFIDGDVEACPEALLRLHTALEQHPHAQAAAALPASGRSRETTQRHMLAERGLAGNLYALRGDFVSRLRARRARLPVGFIWEDGLVGALVKWNLEPKGRWDDDHVVPCPNAMFRFRSLSWSRPTDWRTYWRRRVRYAIGRYQNRMLGPLLKREGLEGMPADILQLYARAAGELRASRAGLDTIFQAIAVRRIRRQRELHARSRAG